jgi:single-stranded DNA-binding protein
MGIDTTGRLHIIFDTKQVSERFTKREFVVEIADNPKYPQMVLFQLSGDRCAQLDEFRVGDQIRIEFSLRGREWRSPQGETKYFNSLDVWKVEAARAGADRGRSGGRDNYNGGGGRSAPRTDDAPLAYDPRPSDSGNRSPDTDDIPF